jgi:hypothetical protein
MSNAATSSQAISPLPPDAEASGFAPVDDTNDTADFSRLIEDTEFVAFLNKIGDFAAAQSNSQDQWERRRKTVQLRKYMLGEYYGVFDKHRGWYSEKEEGDGIYYSPETATFLDTLLKDLVKTKPQKRCEARDADRADKREAARVAEKLLQMDDDQDNTPKRSQREWKWNLLTAGETYRITYFDAQKTGRGITKEKFEKVLIGGGQPAFYCPLCSSTSADAEGKCPQCGNPQLDEYRPLGTEISVKRGFEYQQIGDVDYDVPDALEMTVIGETDKIDEALMVYRQRMIPRCVLADALGDDKLPTTDTPDALSYKPLFDNDSGATVEEFRPLHYEEFWVAPAVVANYTFPSNTPLKNGKVIGKATKGKELFPCGFYFSRISKTVKMLYPQSIGESLSHCVNAIGESFHGVGEWDLIELQDQATEAKSMKMNSMLLDSTQPLIVREGVVDTENFENKFGLVIEAKDYPRDRDLKDAMMRLPAGNPPGEAYQMGEQIKGEMQSRVGAFSTQSDAPDVKAMGTATGIAAISNQSSERRSPALQLYAQMTVDQAYQALELRQKYWPQKMYGPIAKDLGSDAVKWFMECNIRQDINITVLPNSWMPRTETQKQAGLQAFLQLTGQLIAAKGDPKLLDEVIRQGNEVFGGGINFGDFESESIEAQLRLDKLREVGEFVEQQFGEQIYDEMGMIRQEAIALAYSGAAELLRIVGSEPNMFSSVPLDPMFDTHTEFEESYTDWLKTAEGRGSTAFIRTLVRNLAELHIKAENYRMMKLNEFSKVAQIPDLQAELVANDAAHDQALEHGAQDAEQQLEAGAEQKAQDIVMQGAAAQLMPPEAGTS